LDVSKEIGLHESDLFASSRTFFEIENKSFLIYNNSAF